MKVVLPRHILLKGAVICMYVRGIDMSTLSTIFRFDLWTVTTMW